MNFSDSLKSTFLHLLELVSCLCGAYVILSFFGADDSTRTLVLGLAFNSLAKFARASDAVPFPDVVNDVR